METTERRMPRLQRGWLTVYWVGFAVNVLFLIKGLSVAAEVAFASLAALVLAVTASLVGSLFATRIARGRISSTAFVKGTSTIRVISVAWLLIGVAIVSGVIISVIANVDTKLLDWTGGFLGTVGALSVLAIIGPGYSEYREALSAAENPVA